MAHLIIYPNIRAVLAATPRAVLPGRGGRNQHYWFHRSFLSEGDRLQYLFHYRVLRKHADKRLVQLDLIAWVENQGGAFYKRNRDGTYQQMTLAQKLQRVAAVLRDTRTRHPANARPMIEVNAVEVHPEFDDLDIDFMRMLDRDIDEDIDALILHLF